ncbi:flavodoxin family protein [Pseudomonas putida]|uniref:flavodoxin family protein n=1 Tax=Pseudomonas putida TaxID=303 RepID=UPI0020C4BC14|nr:flavodoxin family protein [Pseudomonas putida]UTL83269.1 flavodoxin family protein [Pseudomonas putida]
MSNILIAFGTESGNAEMAADDIASSLNSRGAIAVVKSMEDISADDLLAVGQLVVVTSTYGEGELPETTAPFYADLVEAQPDLSDVAFYAFGLGDSTYSKFNNAIDIVAAKLIDLGASQVGETGRHDAATGKSVTSVAQGWVDKVFK